MSIPSEQPLEACAFACLRMVLARPIPGDSAEINGTAARVTATHSDRFASLQARGSSSPAHRALIRDIRLTSPCGSPSEALQARHSIQVMSLSRCYKIDAAGRHVKDDACAALRAEWQQYHLLHYACSHVVAAACAPLQLVVEAQGGDQVSVTCRELIAAVFCVVFTLCLIRLGFGLLWNAQGWGNTGDR
jgi:hypothetical protein